MLGAGKRQVSRVGNSGTPPVTELGRAARGGALTFVGAASSSALGFLFSLLLARLLGPADAGVVLQAVAIIAIGASIGRLGADTTAVWLLPRLRTESPGEVRPAVALLLLVACAGSVAVLLAWFGVLRWVWPTDQGAGEVVHAVDLVMSCLPAVVLMAVALACTRAFGQIAAFNLVDNLTVPALRPLGLVTVHLAGGGAAMAALAWGAPAWLGLVLAGVVLASCLRSLASSDATSAEVRPRDLLRSDLARRIRAYAGPRAFAQAMEQSTIWLDVLLVGVIAGSAAAGVYGSAARFVAAGLVVATALRIVVAPRFSALLAAGRVAEVGEVYRVTARWILLFGAPVYLTLAVFAPTILGWLGEGFGDGRAALVVLCMGSVVVLTAGNVQSLLLMSGGSMAAAVNKAVVLVVNCAGNLLLVPVWGITAAAAVWAVSMVLDTAMASAQVRRATGVALSWSTVGRVGVGVLVAVGGPLALTAVVLGQGTAALAVGVLAGGVGLLVLCVLERRLLRLGELRALRR